MHEFLGQIVKERAWVLVGSCTPDGQLTPFRAFIEIVRGAFRLGPKIRESVVARKLDEGLQGLGLRSPENLALLLNMLGLKAPEGALASPESVQSLLASRVDRLATADRDLLQAAPAVGRRERPRHHTRAHRFQPRCIVRDKEEAGRGETLFRISARRG